MPIPPGTVIGPYEIVGWLGAGGMGEVYRARDERLGRDVAIKLIPQALATGEGRLRRFEQEARAAGQLNHPNILAVYDLGTYAGGPFIVSELLEGESLRSRLRDGPLTSRKAIDYARQISEGLAAAHDKGIVHRDVKPDNLFVTTDGRVKILDFGIAKLTAPGDDPDRTALLTETAAGMVVGTAAYMSPEQVRGETVDARSDLFSFGAVLFEMLSGRAAFSRATAAETTAAILKEDPTGLFPPTVSPALERIVTRCLEKARESRFQSARDLAFGLEVLSGTTATATSAAGAPAPRRWRAALGAGIVVLSVAAALAAWLTRGTTPATPANPLDNAQFTQLTDWEGTEGGGTISPDGRFVAFQADQTGYVNVWWSPIGGRPLNLTPSNRTLGGQGILRTVGFSGDGSQIWFMTDFGRGPLMITHTTPDAARAFLSATARGAAWSSDGTRMVFFLNGDGDPLQVADSSGADARQMEITPTDQADWSGIGTSPVHNHNPVWASDDQWIYFVHGHVPELNWTDDMDIWRIRPSGGAPERMTRHGTAVTYLTPIDTRTVLYVARAVDGSGPWLWALDVVTKATHRVSSGLEQYVSISGSRDGRHLVATLSNPTSSVWSVPLGARPAAEADAKRYAVPTTRARAPRAVEGALFYLSARGTGDELWRFDIQQNRTFEIWKGADGALAAPPAMSRDGRRIALVVRREGAQRLSIMSADGTGLQRLAESIVVHGTADWSPDGRWIAIGGRDAKGPALFKIPVDGGTPSRLVDGQAVNPVWSRDDLIVYSGSLVAGQVQLHAMRPDGSPVVLPKVETRPGGYRFLPDGTGIVFVSSSQDSNFWLFDLVTKTTRPLTRFGLHGRLREFDVTPDGTHIVFDRTQANSDIVLIDLPKK